MDAVEILFALENEFDIRLRQRETAVGLRDRTAILLLARLGLRAGDIVKMDLSDFDWVSASGGAASL